MNNFNTFSLFAWEDEGVSWRLLNARWQWRARAPPPFLFETSYCVCNVSAQNTCTDQSSNQLATAYRGALPRAVVMISRSALLIGYGAVWVQSHNFFKTNWLYRLTMKYIFKHF